MLGEHRIGADTPAGWAEFERRMEAWRQQERGGAGWEWLHLGTRKSAAVKLHRWSNEKRNVELDGDKTMV